MEMGRDDDWLHYRKADAFSQLDRYDQALAELAVAEKKGKQDIELYSLRAWNFGRLRRNEDAMEQLKKAQELGRRRSVDRQ